MHACEHWPGIVTCDMGDGETGACETFGAAVQVSQCTNKGGSSAAAAPVLNVVS